MYGPGVSGVVAVGPAVLDAVTVFGAEGGVVEGWSGWFGIAARVSDNWGVMRRGSRLVHYGLVVNGGHSAQTDPLSSAVLLAFDPSDDRDPELVAGPPPLTVQHVLL